VNSKSDNLTVNKTDGIREESADSPDSTNIPTRYTVYEMMLLMMDW
jgi:hypothetical protein